MDDKVKVMLTKKEASYIKIILMTEKKDLGKKLAGVQTILAKMVQAVDFEVEDDVAETGK